MTISLDSDPETEDAVSLDYDAEVSVKGIVDKSVSCSFYSMVIYWHSILQKRTTSHHACSTNKCRADLELVFKRGSYIKKGMKLDGWWCTLCKCVHSYQSLTLCSLCCVGRILGCQLAQASTGLWTQHQLSEHISHTRVVNTTNTTASSVRRTISLWLWRVPIWRKAIVQVIIAARAMSVHLWSSSLQCRPGIRKVLSRTFVSGSSLMIRYVFSVSLHILCT